MIQSNVLGKSAMTSLYDHSELLALHGAAPTVTDSHRD